MSNILQIAAKDLLPADPEILDMNERIDEIIRELQQDPDLGDILNKRINEEEGDKGIELDVHAELEVDIEPFDYELEVELGDW